MSCGSPRAPSGMGHKQTLEQALEMSALPTKADMRLAVQKCPLSARSSHSCDERKPRTVMRHYTLTLLRITHRLSPDRAAYHIYERGGIGEGHDQAGGRRDRD
jgi:hypothetical protein